MKLSQKGVDFIKAHEALRLKAYQDSKGVWTIGWGHTKGVKPGDVITREQAERRKHSFRSFINVLSVSAVDALKPCFVSSSANTRSFPRKRSV